ncbi:MAG: hypothetical protein JW751_21660 [Polyangiaceae bacterium]|nr:hypothetical protein [Polyangiaceae bacterium]
MEALVLALAPGERDDIGDGGAGRDGAAKGTGTADDPRLTLSRCDNGSKLPGGGRDEDPAPGGTDGSMDGDRAVSTVSAPNSSKCSTTTSTRADGSPVSPAIWSRSTGPSSRDNTYPSSGVRTTDLKSIGAGTSRGPLTG